MMRALILFLLSVFSAVFLNAQEAKNEQEIKNTQEAKVIQAVLETTSGKITLELFLQVAPKAVENMDIIMEFFFIA